jgi:hypothetical protein
MKHKLAKGKTGNETKFHKNYERKQKSKPKSQTRTLETNLKKLQFLQKFFQKGNMGCEQNREKK